MKLFVDNLTHVDFSYLHPQRGLMGESWEVQLVLEGKLDEQGMICDFGVVKKRIKTWLDTHVDHMLVVATGMSRLSWQQSAGETQVDWTYPTGERFVCKAPDQAIALIPVMEIQQQAVAKWCETQLLALFPEQVESLELRFVAEAIEGAFYHYSHGLQQHRGNCQRIAHGHRSRMQVRVDQKRRQDLELYWSQQFEDIYLGTQAHLLSSEDNHALFVYEAPQGRFELLLPMRCCYMMETETTVEQIADHLAQAIKSEYPDSTIEVRAYEGVGKGAIATK